MNDTRAEMQRRHDEPEYELMAKIRETCERYEAIADVDRSQWPQLGLADSRWLIDFTYKAARGEDFDLDVKTFHRIARQALATDANKWTTLALIDGPFQLAVGTFERAQKPTSLYRFFDDQGRLLYVGITERGAMRWGEHRKDKHWWDDVASSTIEHFATRSRAEAAEKSAIQAERPLYNGTHNTQRAEMPEPLPQICNECGECGPSGWCANGLCPDCRAEIAKPLTDADLRWLQSLPTDPSKMEMEDVARLADMNRRAIDNEALLVRAYYDPVIAHLGRSHPLAGERVCLSTHR